MPWRRTPTWITLGGTFLAMTAGYVNAIGFIGAHEHGLTHVTGQVTRVGIELSKADLGATFRAAMLVIWFFAGAVLSGVIVQRAELTERGRRYAVVMAIEALLLAVATTLLVNGASWAENLVALAAGLQNAMATSYSGAVVRTTHMTGIVTDLGIILGHALRGEQIEREKFGLLGMLLFSFISGGVIGAYGAPQLHEFALVPPMVILAIASVAYTVRAHRVPDPHRPGALASRH